MGKEDGALDPEDAKSANVTEKIISEYAKAAFCNVCDFYEITDGVLTVKPLSKIPESAAGAIAGLKQTKEGVEIKFYDKYKALEAIAKIMGLAENGEEQSESGEGIITVNHCVPRPGEEPEDGGDKNDDNA